MESHEHSASDVYLSPGEAEGGGYGYLPGILAGLAEGLRRAEQRADALAQRVAVLERELDMAGAEVSTRYTDNGR